MWPRQTHCGRSTSSATLDPEKFDCMQILTNNKCQKSLEYLGSNLTSLLIEQLSVHHLLDGIIQYLTHLTLCAIGFRRHDMARYFSRHGPWPFLPHLTSCFSGGVKVCPVTELSLLDQERPQPAVEYNNHILTIINHIKTIYCHCTRCIRHSAPMDGLHGLHGSDSHSRAPMEL